MAAVMARTGTPAAGVVSCTLRWKDRREPTAIACAKIWMERVLGGTIASTGTCGTGRRAGKSAKYGTTRSR